MDIAGASARSAGDCRICGGPVGGSRVTAREMMFGSRETFDYVTCSDCGTLQIARVPEDLGRHYDAMAYYSFNNAVQSSIAKRLLTRIAAAGMVGRPERYPRGFGLMDRIRRGAEPWIANVPGLKRSSKVLDVGCGEGLRLARLAQLGFSSLVGVDPFLPAEKAGRNVNGIDLLRGHLSDVHDQFDLVMLHHSLEHVADPGEMLRLARGLLEPGGLVLVRIPVLQEQVWLRYGVNWAQLDAPRHIYLFTVDGFERFAGRQGLKVLAKGFDSQGWSYAWSEAYARDIPMFEPDGKANALPRDMDGMAEFEALASSLNGSGEGDSAWFVLNAD